MLHARNDNISKQYGIVTSIGTVDISHPMKRYLRDVSHLPPPHIVLISYHGNLIRHSDLVQLLLYTLYSGYRIRKALVGRERG